MNTTHIYQNSAPTQFDSNCSHCDGKARDAIHAKQFQPGKTYQTRSIGDADCLIRVTVAKRTAATLTTTEGKIFRIKPPDAIWDCEFIRPWGSYSMAPFLRADQEVKA